MLVQDVITLGWMDQLGLEAETEKYKKTKMEWFEVMKRTDNDCDDIQRYDYPWTKHKQKEYVYTSKLLCFSSKTRIYPLW